jgi:hypothetical protein
MPTSDALDTRIRSLVAELIESAPQAPLLPELEWNDTELSPVTGIQQRRRRPRFVVAAFAGAVAAVLLVVGLIPVVAERQHHPTTPTTPTLTNGQWLYSEQRVAVSMQVSLGNRPTPAAQATIPATLKIWASRFNQVCVSITAQPVTFASATNRDAWHALGLRTTPSPNPWTTCTSDGSGPAAPPAQLPIDASHLSTAPTALAQDLQNGTTGIRSLDSWNIFATTGYERAVALLLGPTTGNTPAVNTALYHALPLIPDVHTLGRMTTHTGATGIGFAAKSSPFDVLIVNPNTGTLLEVQNPSVTILGVNDGLPDQYIPETTHGGVGETAITVQWLDPIGRPSIVDTHALPADLKIPPVATYTANIVALAKPTVTGNQVNYLGFTLRKLNNPSCINNRSVAKRAIAQGRTQPLSTYSDTDAGRPANLTYYCTGSTADAATLAHTLKASGLFSSVTVTYANPTPATSAP